MTLETNFSFLVAKDMEQLQKMPDMVPSKRLNWAAKIIGNYGKEAAVAFNKDLLVLGDIDLDDEKASKSLEDIIDLISKETLLGLSSIKWHSHDDKKRLKMAIKIADIGRQQTFNLKNNLNILGQIDISDPETRELLASLIDTMAGKMGRSFKYQLANIMQNLQLINSTPENLAEIFIKFAEKGEIVTYALLDYIADAEAEDKFHLKDLSPEKCFELSLTIVNQGEDAAWGLIVDNIDKLQLDKITPERCLELALLIAKQDGKVIKVLIENIEKFRLNEVSTNQRLELIKVLPGAILCIIKSEDINNSEIRKMVADRIGKTFGDFTIKEFKNLSLENTRPENRLDLAFQLVEKEITRYGKKSY